MKLLYILLSATLLVACNTQTTAPAVNYLENYVSDVTYLAHDSLEGREVGTQGEVIAATYIAERMKKIGLIPKGDDSSYFQVFTRKMKAHPHDTLMLGDEIEGRNVLGFIDNNSKSTIVIGAHYDHLGYGEEGSLSDSAGQIHNGADDNASGVAAMLGLASKFKNVKLKSNVLFIAFTGEEKGLWGSNYFVKNSTLSNSEMNFMINMDMVGRLDSNNRLAIYGIGTSPVFKPILDSCNTWGFKSKFDSSGVGPSDHTSFYLADVPVLHFFTGQHKDYHKPTDDTEFINFEGIVKVADYIESVVLSLNKFDTIPFTKTKETSNKARAFKVTLGVIPDYLYDGAGMRIDGIKQERPAQIAGIEKGDVVVKMGEFEVKNMTDYMNCLSKFEKGITVIVQVKRGESVLNKKVVF
ncbi:MAG: Zn-dependent M28 family amino/carboxypeptidase [Urechidicola sp.]|jgi:Zn-dependent M28 family amino/carboxypeptidase|tara:strand:- start:731 stop:1960 length:1230 start_codon:yes stop_codon:yes gene_type:complete